MKSFQVGDAVAIKRDAREAEVVAVREDVLGQPGLTYELKIRSGKKAEANIFVREFQIYKLGRVRS